MLFILDIKYDAGPRLIMRYLFESLNNIKPLLKDSWLFIFLDYDGTIVPIRPKPGLAVISKRAKNLLRELSQTTQCKLAVISGRSVKDICRMVGLKNVIYGGNHGLELKGPQLQFKSPVSQLPPPACRMI